MYGETVSIKCSYKENFAYRDQILVTSQQNTSKHFFFTTGPIRQSTLYWKKRKYRENLASANMQNVKGASMKIWRKHLPCG